VGAGALSQGVAEAAVAPGAAIAGNVVLEGDDTLSKNNKAKLSGGNNRNAVSANSPTKNQGFQHNSGSNVARQISIQSALCKRTKKCRISQKFISRRPFVGFNWPHVIRKGKIAQESDFRFFWDDTRATTIRNPTMTSLSVENP
jgi:hypothetical protein